jgi:hypothetical protein
VHRNECTPNSRNLLERTPEVLFTCNQKNEIRAAARRSILTFLPNSLSEQTAKDEISIFDSAPRSACRRFQSLWLAAYAVRRILLIIRVFP